MRKLILTLVGAAAFAATLMPGTTRAAGPLLYPLPALILDAKHGGASAEAMKLINPLQAGGYFRDQFKLSFPDAEDTITDATSRRTFVVSMQIPRVSSYVLPKVNGTVERQLAMTGSLYFTNVTTGEVLFTYTATSYLTKTYAQSAGDPSTAERAEIYNQLYQGLVSDLLTKAHDAFKPYEVSANAAETYGQLVVLDKGQLQGIGLGDTLTSTAGAEVKVIFADAAYALALPQFGGKAASGGVWSKFSAKTLSDVRKVPVIVRVVENGSNFADDTIQQMFADATGEKSALSVVPVNASYAQVVNGVRQLTNISREKTAARRLPRYFVRLTVARPVTYEAPTNLSYKTSRVARASVYAELVDQSGRVQFAGSGEDTIRDDVTAGMGYAAEARAEIAVKNAVIDLARKMSGQLKLAQTDIPVSSVAQNGVDLADKSGVLKIGSSVAILRSINAIKGVAAPVYAPIWTARIVELGEQDAKASLDLAVYASAPSPRVGDMVRVDLMKAAAPRNARRFAPCGTSEALGSRKLEGFATMAANQFAAGSGQENYFSEFIDKVSGELQATGEFSSDPSVALPAQDVCLEPVNRIDLVAENCDANAVCISDLTLRVTYRLRRGDQVVLREGLETVVHTSAYYKSMAEADKQALIDAEVSSSAAALLKTVSTNPTFQKALAGL